MWRFNCDAKSQARERTGRQSLFERRLAASKGQTGKGRQQQQGTREKTRKNNPPRRKREQWFGITAAAAAAAATATLHIVSELGRESIQRMIRGDRREKNGKACNKHTHLVVAGVNPHGLLSHGRLVRVSRGLVVVGERDDGGAHAEDHAGVDLAVRVRARVAPRLLQVLGLHGNHGSLLLLRVDVLHHSLGLGLGPPSGNQSENANSNMY